MIPTFVFTIDRCSVYTVKLTNMPYVGTLFKVQFIQESGDPEIPKLSEEDMLNCEGIISKDECDSAIRTFKNGKSPGTDGLPAEFYKIFWNDVIDLVIDSYQYIYLWS